MAELFAIAFVGGLITGISPCIIPVLPVIAAGGTIGAERRRPFLIIGGLIVSFTLQEFIGASVLSALGLPSDFLRWLGIGVLLALAVALLFPPVWAWVERPFYRFGASRFASRGSGFVLGLSLGLVFAPCAGPVYSAIAAATAQHRISADLLFTALFYAVGAGVPLLILAILAQRATTKWSNLRTQLPSVRRAAGAVVGATALVIAFGGFDYLQTHTPGYTSALENSVESNVCTQLSGLSHEQPNQFVVRMEQLEGHSFSCTGEGSSQSTVVAAPKGSHGTTTTSVASGKVPMNLAAEVSNVNLPKLGRAPNFAGIVSWFNTPGNQPLSLSQLRGKVVLIDFWTYSCINCQRALPHVEGWYNRYKDDGLVVVGVSTPEFAFEHVVSNVKSAAGNLGVDYPVAIDNNYGTWNAYNNEYWPADYLIDQTGQVRAYDFGEGGYGGLENSIRKLLAVGRTAPLPPRTDVPDKTPTTDLTQETYIGYTQVLDEGYDPGVWVGTPFVRDKTTNYQAPSSIPSNGAALDGTWTSHGQEATSGANASLDLRFTATDVYLVLGGKGTVTVDFNGRPINTVKVSGVPTLYTLLSGSELQRGLLTLQFTPGVEAYDFTFG